MTYKSLLAAASAGFFALAAAPMAFAGDITVEDAYLRVSGAMAKTAAAFMVIQNHGDADRLISATSDLSKRVELHTHQSGGDGIMKMVHVEEGFEIPADGTHMLARGGDHVMFLGLTEVPKDGDVISVTLTFEKAGDVTVDVPVDNARKPEAGMDHSKMDHGAMKHGADASN